MLNQLIQNIYTRVLLDLHSSNDLNTLINSINLTLNTYIDNQNINNTELLMF